MAAGATAAAAAALAVWGSQHVTEMNDSATSIESAAVKYTATMAIR